MLSNRLFNRAKPAKLNEGNTTMNVMLHVHNVAWLGGVPAFIADFAAAFPEFLHQSLYLKDGGEDRGAIQMLNDAGVRTAFYGDKLGPVIIDKFDPAMIIWHNISGSSLTGSHPWPWVKRWPSISYHHSPVSPTIPTHLHIFVSDYLRGMYQNLLDSGYIKNHCVIPPCIQAGRYAHIRRFSGVPSVIGKIATPGNANKYPPELLEVAKRTGCKLLMPGAGIHLESDPDIIDVPVNWFGVSKHLARMSVFLYVNSPAMGPETWGRAVTEAMAAGIPVIGEDRGGVAEQINNGVTGFLVGPNPKGGIDVDAICSCVSSLVWGRVDANAMGCRARAWVQKYADISVLRRELSHRVLGLVAGGVC